MPLTLHTGVAIVFAGCRLHVAGAVALQSTAFALGRVKPFAPFPLLHPLACQLPSTSHLCGISGTMAVTMEWKPHTQTCLLATIRFPTRLNRLNLTPRGLATIVFPFQIVFAALSAPFAASLCVESKVGSVNS